MYNRKTSESFQMLICKIRQVFSKLSKTQAAHKTET